MLSCNPRKQNTESAEMSKETNKMSSVLNTTLVQEDTLNQKSLKNTDGISKHELVNFAKTLIGTPYKYASTNPKTGFDCSGFITYVFNHFNISVPRSSFEFTNAGKHINRKDAEEGDLILFTETYESSTKVGHMGIITDNINDSLKFIHSTSGKAYGVTISSLTPHYLSRFVKVIRVLEN